MRTWKEGNLRITIKDKQELQIMRESGKILGIVLHELQKFAVAGITTAALDEKAAEIIKSYGAKASFKGYHGYPANICTSVNDQVVHGIPGNYILRDGDILTIDAGVLYKEFHSDSAITIGIGALEPAKLKFIATAEKALAKAIATVRAGIRVRQISSVIQDTVEKNGYSCVRDLVGHGIGKQLHEDPQIPNFRDEDPGPILQTGMTIAIEPIITMGDYKVKILRDGWTFVTKDGSLSAQVEHTIAVTEKGAEILTQRPF